MAGMMQSLMGGSGGGQGGGMGLEGLMNMGRQMAESMQASNPELVTCAYLAFLNVCANIACLSGRATAPAKPAKQPEQRP